MKKMHYGWVICITCTLLLFVNMGTVSNGFSFYLPYIMEEKGLTNAQTSSLVTLRCAVSFLSMLVIGFYYQKVSIRVGTTIAAAAAGVSFLLNSAAVAYPLFCVGAASSGVGSGLGSMIPVSILINRWFYQHRALALSICASGSGIATIVLPPVTTALVENLSMATTFRIGAGAIFLLAAVIFLALRNQPADKGLLPCGQTQAQAQEALSEVDLGEEFTDGTDGSVLYLYYAQEGERIFDIAKRYHARAKDLAAANHLETGGTAPQDLTTESTCLLIPAAP